MKTIKIEEDIETRQAEVRALREHVLDLNLPAEDIVSRTQLYIESLPKGQPTQVIWVISRSLPTNYTRTLLTHPTNVGKIYQSAQ